MNLYKYNRIKIRNNTFADNSLVLRSGRYCCQNTGGFHGHSIDIGAAFRASEGYY